MFLVLFGESGAKFGLEWTDKWHEHLVIDVTKEDKVKI